MKYTVQRCLLFFILLGHATLSAVSMVYNFRIAQITKQPIFEKPHDRNHTVIALLFDQYRKKYNGIFQNFAGGLGSYIYDFEPYYFRVDFAVSHIKAKSNHTTTFSGTETDDILFTLGRNIVRRDRSIGTLSGLLGIPTHRIFRLQHTDFGYSQLGTGIQYDGSYAINHTNTLLYGARYIYFVPRKALDDLRQKHTFTLGNIGDLLFAYKNNWNEHQGIELGYTARFRFGAHIVPSLDNIVKKTNYIRSNFYAVYKYKFLINNISNRLLFYLSYGFDHTPKVYGNKYIVTLWTSWNIAF
jgi:hypothetical protein